ncbi:MAG: YraN family protein [Fimbriimonadaceae bacterium]|nr:YraN family protein [Fimbriimonadaceae bacterium]
MRETAKSKGKQAEDQAAQYLLSLGYTLITRRFKTRHGEIDLIALDGETLVFVEVKFRARNTVSPEESVTDLKSARFQSAVAEYFSKTDQPPMPARYDLIAIDQAGLRHHKNAIV